MAATLYPARCPLILAMLSEVTMSIQDVECSRSAVYHRQLQCMSGNGNDLL